MDNGGKKMFRELRRKDKSVSLEEAISILASQTNGVLAVNGDDGYPYAVPVSYVYEDGKIHFHCSNVEGHKLSALKNNPKVSFCVVAKDDIKPADFSTKFASAIAFGKARIIENMEEMYGPLMLILEKYSPDFIEDGKEYIDECKGQFLVVTIDIEHLTGKAPK